MRTPFHEFEALRFRQIILILLNKFRFCVSCAQSNADAAIRHYKISDQAGEINIVLRGHYAYYGVAGNLRSLVKVYRAVARYWRKMLRSRSWAGRCLTWDAFNQIKERIPLLKPKLRLPYGKLQALAVL